MNKLRKDSKLSIFICAISIFTLIGVLSVLIFFYIQGSANLAKQQEWSSGKDSFDKAYEIAASDKKNYIKTLYIPNLTSLIGKTVDEAIISIGNGASLTSASPVNGDNSGITSQSIITLKNESSSDKIGAPTAILYTDKDSKILKVSFSCNVNLLGYGNYSFTDMINNEHVIEKSFAEAGLNIPEGTIVAPTNKASYTTYANDGVAANQESCTFSGNQKSDKILYKWESSLTYDYTLANIKGNLEETVRTIVLLLSN